MNRITHHLTSILSHNIAPIAVGIGGVLITQVVMRQLSNLEENTGSSKLYVPILGGLFLAGAYFCARTLLKRRPPAPPKKETRVKPTEQTQIVPSPGSNEEAGKKIACTISLPSLLCINLPPKGSESVSLATLIIHRTIEIAGQMGFDTSPFRGKRDAGPSEFQQLLNEMEARASDQFILFRESLNFLIQQASRIYSMHVEDVLTQTKEIWEPIVDWLEATGYLTHPDLRDSTLQSVLALNSRGPLIVCDTSEGLTAHVADNIPTIDATAANAALKKCVALGKVPLCHFVLLGRDELHSKINGLQRFLDSLRINSGNQLALGKALMDLKVKSIKSIEREHKNTYYAGVCLYDKICRLLKRLNDYDFEAPTLSDTSRLLASLKNFQHAAKMLLLRDRKLESVLDKYKKKGAKKSDEKSLPQTEATIRLADQLIAHLEGVSKDLAAQTEVQTGELDLELFDFVRHSRVRHRRHKQPQPDFELPENDDPDVEDIDFTFEETAEVEVPEPAPAQLTVPPVPQVEDLLTAKTLVGLWSGHLWDLERHLTSRYQVEIQKLDDTALRQQAELRLKELAAKLRLCLVDLERLAEALSAQQGEEAYVAYRCLCLDLALGLEQFLVLQQAIQNKILYETHHLGLLARGLKDIEPIQNLCGKYSLALYWVRYHENSIARRGSDSLPGCLIGCNQFKQYLQGASIDFPGQFINASAEDALAFLSFLLPADYFKDQELDRLKQVVPQLSCAPFTRKTAYQISDKTLKKIMESLARVNASAQREVAMCLKEAQHLLLLLDISLQSLSKDERLSTRLWHMRNALIVDKIAEMLYLAICHQRGIGHVEGHQLAYFQKVLNYDGDAKARLLHEFNLGIHHHYQFFGSRNFAVSQEYDGMQRELPDALLNFSSQRRAKTIDLKQSIEGLQALANWVSQELTSKSSKHS